MSPRRFGALVALLAFFATFSFATAAQADVFSGDALAPPATTQSGPTIVSDKADYGPGETVTLTGGGWQPGEAVRVIVNDDGLNPEQPWQRDVTVTADETGAVSDQFNLPNWFVANYSVDATGDQSGTATTTFTDAVNTTTTVTSTPNPSQLNQSVTFTATVTCTSTCTFDGTQSVSFVENANQNCNGGTATLGTVSGSNLTGSGLTRQAALTTSTLAAGSHSIRACFSGGGSGSTPGASTSVALTQVVNAAQGTSLSAGNASGTFGGTTNLSATLTAGSPAAGVSGKTISFSLNGANVGSATTNASGTATLTGASLTGINAGSYTTGVAAAFAGDSGYSASNGTAQLAVAKATPSITVNWLDSTYDGSTHPATASVSGVGNTNLGAVDSLTYYAGTTASGTPLAGAPTGAGTYTVRAHFNATANYLAADQDKTITIGKATPTIVLTWGNSSYDGASHPASASVTGVNGADLGRADTYTYYSGTIATGTPLSSAPANAGDYTVRAHYNGSANYTAADRDRTITISKASQAISFAALAGKTYGDPALGVSASGGGSGNPVTFSVGASDNCTSGGANGATITLTGAGNCTVTANQAGNSNYDAAAAVARGFTIAKADPSVTVNWSNSTYNGSANAATATAKGVGAADLGSADSLTYYAGTTASGSPLAGAPSNAGTYTVNAHFNASTNYNGADKTRTISIAQAGQAISFGPLGDKTYGDSPFTVSAAGGGSGKPVTFSVGAGDNCTTSGANGATITLTGAGSCTVTADQLGDSNYNAASSVSRTFSIGKATPTIVLTWGNSVFDGASHPAAASVTGAGGANLGAADTLTYYSGGDATGTPLAGPPTDVGEYTVRAHFNGSANYTAADQDRTIAIAKATPTIALDWQNSTYDGGPNKAQAPVSGVKGADLGTATLAYYTGDKADPASKLDGAPTNAGDYFVSADYAGSDNYAGAHAEAAITIAKRTLKVTADAQTKTYGEPDPTLSYQLTDGALVSGEHFGGAPARDPGEDVGSYDINQGTLDAGQNYKLEFTGAKLAISKRALEVTADAQSKTYGQDDPALTYTITHGSLAFSDKLSGDLSRDAGEDVGSYAIKQGTLAAGSNYELSFKGAQLAIAKRALEVTADARSKTYGDTDPDLTYRITSGTLVSGDKLSGALTRAAGENVGSYDIKRGTLDAGSNYDLSYVGAKLAITKRALEVTADAQSKTYGQDDPALTYTVTHGSLAFSDKLSGDLSRDAGEDVGSYDITRGTLDAGSNYDLTFKRAQLTISARHIEVTADAQSKTYGDDDPALTYKVTGGSVVTGDSFSGQLTRDAGENAGSYDIKQGTLKLSSNYDLTFKGAQLTISARRIEVTADAQSKSYGAGDPALTYKVTKGSLVNGDAFSGSLKRDAGENVGAYDIKRDTLDAGSNYDLSYVGAKLTITQRKLTVSADPQTKVYGDNDPAFTYQVTGGSLVGSDSVTGQATRDAGANVGSYDIKQGSVTAGPNYDLTFNGAKLTITQKALAIRGAVVNTRQYNGVKDASVDFTGATLDTPLSGDDVKIDSSGYTAQYGSKDVGTGLDVAVSGVKLSGVAAPNYSVSQPKLKGDITRRPLTVTADAKTKTYGNGDPALTYQVTSGSLVSGESFSGGLTRDSGENVGSYDVKQGSLTAGSNYDLSFGGAKLTIAKRAIEVTADAKSKTYGDADPALSYQVTKGSLATGDSFSGALTRDPGSSVGSYDIKLGSLASGPNYDQSFVGAKLTINKKPIAVTPDNKTKFLNGPDPSLTYAFTPQLVSGDSFLGSLTRDSGEAIGSYPIHQGSLALNSNYTLSWAGDGTLTIQYPPSSGTGGIGTCAGSPNREILQPVNADSTSVFKKGSTVPLKFRVCDAKGNPVGPTTAAPNIVKTFERVANLQGDPGPITEAIDSSTPDTTFRWSATDQQWIFNLSTKSMSTGSYFYKITLNDGTALPTFGFGLR